MTVKFITSAAVSVSNGSKTVTVTGADSYYVYNGTSVFIDSYPPVEGVSGTVADGSGNSTITLDVAWPNATVTNGSLVAYNTNEGLPEAIRYARSLANVTKALKESNETLLTGTTATVSVEIDGVATDFVPYQYLVDQLGGISENSIIVYSMSKATFNSEAIHATIVNNCSGNLEWGGHLNTTSNINDGLWTDITTTKQLNYGRDTSPVGISKTDMPITLVNGVRHITHQGQTDNSNYINFPDAVDGLSTYDAVTDTYVTHADIATSFGAVTGNVKMILTRKDLVIYETWHERISGDAGIDGFKDEVYLYGNVQSAVVNPYGIISATKNNGYTKMGKWDATTTGQYVTWSTMTTIQKLQFITEPDNNIYYASDVDSYIQVRSRFRVIQGMGDSWADVRPNVSDDLRYSNNHLVKPQGQLTTITADTGIRNTAESGGYSGYKLDQKDVGAFTAMSKVGAIGDAAVGYDGKCHAVPIALVQRENSGAHSPVWNPNGCSRPNSTSTATTGAKWYESASIALTSTQLCFTGYAAENDIASPGKANASGTLATGASGRDDTYLYHDIVYNGQVEDLRLSARPKDVNQLRVDSIRKAVRGEMRGKGKVPFTQSIQTTQTATASTTGIQISGGEIDKFSVGDVVSLYRDSTGITLTKEVVTEVDYVSNFIRTNISYQRFAESYHVLLQTELTAEYDSIPQVDLLGSPSELALEFPSGIVGEWIPVLETTGTKPLNRKSSSTTASYVYKANGGNTWTPGTNTLDTTNNVLSGSFDSMNYIWILNYASHSDFTESSSNSVVVGDVGDVWTGVRYEPHHGNRLQPSLTGKVGKNSTTANGLHKYLSVLNYGADERTGLINSSWGSPEHEPLTFGQPSSGGGVKALSTLTEKDGLLYLQLHGSELLYDPTSFSGWGDNEIIPTISGDGTQSDTNDSTVITFCHHTMIPLAAINK